MDNRTDIAIIGVGMRMANAKTLDEYWEILSNKINCVSDFPPHRIKDIAGFAKEFFKSEQDFSYYPGSFIDRIDEFDYEFFQLSPREASLMDPVQRMFLEVVYSTFQDAGYSAKMLSGTKTGTFLGYTSGSMSDNYLTAIALNSMDQMQYALTGNMAALIPSRAAHYLNLKGPTMVLDTACSSALVSVHEACEAIKSGVCDMALAGGIKLHLLPVIDESSKIGIEEYNGRTRSFDNGASGASIGEGVIAVLLKPLDKAQQDGDAIYAVIKGTGINHDGTSSGLTAPNPVAQSQALRSAWENAGIDPANLEYIEAHGTATSLGDPIEIQGITKALASYTDKKQFCAVGSSKSNMGHLYECSGLAALLKAVCALREKVIPANLHFLEPNSNINFVNSPIYINSQTQKWIKRDNTPRICGVSAFGIGGTNCHIVLQEYIDAQTESASCVADIPTTQLFTLSAKSQYSLTQMVVQNLAYINDKADSLNFSQFCHNTNTLRDLHDHRLAVVAAGFDDLICKLNSFISQKDLLKFDGGIHFGILAKAGGNIADMRARRAGYAKLTDTVKDIIQNKDANADCLNQIAQQFVLGGDICWESLYGKVKPQKMHLPVYPFERSSMWLESLRQPAPEIKKHYYQKHWVEKENTTAKNNINRLALIDFGADCFGQIHKSASEHFAHVSVYSAKDEHMLAEQMDTIFLEADDSTAIVLCPDTLFCSGSKSLQEQLETQPKHLKALLNIAQKAYTAKYLTRLFVMADNSFEVNGHECELKPESTTLFGFGKGIRKENPNATFSYFDMQSTDDISTVMTEISHWDKQEIICIRDKKRYIEGLREVSLPQWGEWDTGRLLKADGVYVITGGLGGIGFEVAKTICHYAPQCTLLLFGRTPLGERVGQLQELKQLAKNADYFAADTSDMAAIEQILAQSRQKYGCINGVVHAAGIGGGTDICDMGWQRIQELFAAKVYGTLVLDHLTRADSLDFFVMFSSIATVFSSSGLAGYAAANTFLDAYSAYRQKHTKGVSKTINWATWSQTGMSVKNDFTIDTLFKAINNKDGVQSFFDTLASEEKNVIAGELNLDSGISLLLKTYPMEYSDYINEKLTQRKAKKDSPKTASSAKVAKTDSSITEVISHACREVLGYDEIDESDSFFELGADSILMSHIYSKIEQEYPGRLVVTDLFEYPSVSMLAQYLSDKDAVANQRNSQSKQRLSTTTASGKDVAIIGTGFYLPCADTLEQYYELLSNGINAVRAIPPERADCLKRHFDYMRLANGNYGFTRIGYLTEIDKFDYALFGISPKDARLMDPAARLALQCCWKAIEDAGYGGERMKGANAGVFLGCTSNLGNMYSRMIFEADPVLFGESLPVNQVSMIASRIAYVNDLKGPSMVIDTACSSSLVSINMAYEQIVSGKCDMALAGGVSLSLMPLDTGEGDYRMGFESSGIKTRAFSDGSDGTAVGEGVGVVLLKSLESALESGDHIYAVIKGGAVNQDGSSFGIAAPNYLAQSEVIQKAWSTADTAPESVSYMEAHGTGTHLGDTIEVKGITHAFSQYTSDKQFCGFGSVKTNIGHLSEASGVSGLLKLLLMFGHKELFPSLNFSQPNPVIDFLHTPLYMVTKRTPWQTDNTPRRAGISGFGMSGTNCHLVLEEPPEITQKPTATAKPYAIVLSCMYGQGLGVLCGQLHGWLVENADASLQDIAYTLSVGRRHYTYRAGIIAHSCEDLQVKLLKISTQPIAEIVEDWFFKGYHKIVPESKHNRTDFEILATECNQMTAQASQLVEGAVSAGDLSQAVYCELLQLYAKGAKINWTTIATIGGQKPCAVSLPAYPFQRKHVWVDIYDPEFDHMYYQTTWIAEEIAEISTQSSGQTYIVFVQSHSMKEQLKIALSNQGINAVFFSIGDNAADAFKAISHLVIDKIIFICCGDGEVNSLDSIDQQMNSGFYSLISLVKGAFVAHFNQTMEIVIVAETAYAISGQEQRLIPANAAVLSLGKVIEQEYPTMQCRAIDTDRETPLEKLVAEILQPDHQVYLVGYRDGNRYCECADSAPVEGVHRSLRVGGNYLVTGGTGDIGVQTALYLSQSGCASVTLTSRNGFRERSQWDLPDLSDMEKEKIRIFKEIERSGTKLKIAAVDVCDYNAVSKLLGQIRSEFGGLNGVFHSAGVAGAGFILRKEMAEFESVLAPKIKGTLILDELTKDDSLDFMVLYSSAVTMSGEAGQSDYVAANAFLDAFCDYRNNAGKRTFAVNWVSWKETGMSVRYGINVDTITRAIPTALAIKGLDTLLRSSYRRVMIGQYNINENLLAVTKYSRNRSSASMLQLQEKLARMFEFNKDNNVLLQSDREIATIENGKLRMMPYSKKMEEVGRKSSGPKLTISSYSLEETQDNIALVYMAVLGYEEIDPYQNFFDMGGDSIMLTKMHSYIDTAYQGTITVADLFAYTTVEAISQYIFDQLCSG